MIINKGIRGLLIGWMLVLLVSTAMAQQVTSPREFRAAWIATLWNIDWPANKLATPQQQQTELLQMLDRATALHLNAIIFQVRPEADAFYISKYEPWSDWLTGVQGKAPNPVWDPLEFVVEESHKRGLELHAWINPYRAASRKESVKASNHISVTKPDLVYTYDNFLWMDPGKVETNEYFFKIVKDIVTRYDIDGLHMDDYFYPYPAGRDFPDTATYQKYLVTGGSAKLQDWRRENINTMVKKLHLMILQEKPWVKFGISPAAIWKSGVPEGVSGLGTYTDLYADTRRWLQAGWVDYMVPQIYWKISAPRQPFEKILNWWVQQNAGNRHIYAGCNNAAVGKGRSSWEPSEIVNQVKISRQVQSEGVVFWSYKSLYRNTAGMADILKSESFSHPALPPMMPWKDALPVEKPRDFNVTMDKIGDTLLEWKTAEDAKVWKWAIYKKISDNQWELIRVLPKNQVSCKIPMMQAKGLKTVFALTAVDRLSNESSRVEGSVQ